MSKSKGQRHPGLCGRSKKANWQKKSLLTLKKKLELMKKQSGLRVLIISCLVGVICSLGLLPVSTYYMCIKARYNTTAGK